MSINGRMEEQECVNVGAANGENENVGTFMQIHLFTGSYKCISEKCRY